jgi:hypothetical protein
MRDRPRRTHVIGQQMAQALEAEQARLSKPYLEPSPFPAGLHYDRTLGNLDLSDPVKSPVDDELRALCSRFALSDPAGRSRLRGSTSMDDFYTLLSFGRRCAVFAMRDREATHIADGLTAIAMIETNRIDFRDALLALSLLHHSAVFIGANPVDLFERAASLAESKMSELILGFLKRSEDWRDIQKSWGYTVIETKAGPGFLGWGSKSYQPTYPLDQVGLALAQLIRQDKYQPMDVTLASDLPAFWLSSVDDDALKRALTTVRAVVTVNSNLRPQSSQDSRSQILIIFLAELSDEIAAGALFQLADAKRRRPAEFVMAAAKEGRLFCLAIQRSFVWAGTPIETPATMQRFSSAMGDVLKRYREAQHKS